DFQPSGALWDTLQSLQPYDLVLLSCDGQSDNTSDKNDGALQAMFDYANMGGRIFASHYQNVWFKKGPDPFPQIANFVAKSGDHVGPLSASIVTTFPKGQAMADWAQAAGALDANGQVDIINGERTVAQENTMYAQRWLASDDPATVQYISANTPFGATDDKQCGRVVFSDLHVSAGRLPADNPPAGDDFSTPSTPFPEGCVSSGFTPQEKVLAFMLFDLSACVVPDNVAPTPPPIIR
ncbi:MAG TPA: carboxypeptidase regulatory-like domain-containing protein, partial [Polyangiaceae bacterium]|nr:carboxypeptidase regulatory-like domain-containing protein [Polyangiaceae bacterium]